MRAALLALTLLITACRPAVPPLADGLTWLTAPADPLQWSGGEWFPLVTPVRAPTSIERTVHIFVALHLPRGAVLGPSIPPGARAVRVEFAGSTNADDGPDARWNVLDVRSFEWSAEGLTCGVLRPAERGLAGLSWACGATADEKAGQALATLVRTGWLRSPADDTRREAAATGLARINGCVACHARGREEDRSVTALVQRGADGDGLFSLRSVFRDEDPVERYRPVNPNEGDALLTPVCPGSTIDLAAGRCADGLRPRLQLDVARGLAAGDRHVKQLCDARRRLALRLDASTREAVAQALSACQPP